jgi:hypothetical protein
MERTYSYLGPFDVAFEDERAGGVVLAEERCAGQEHDVEPALRVHHGQPGVQRKMHVAVLFLAGCAQRAEAPDRPAVDGVLRDERARFWLADEDGAAAVLDRSDAAQHHAVEDDHGRVALGEGEAPEAGAARVEHLHASDPSRRIRDNERPVVGEVERRRAEDAAGFGANLDDPADAVACRGNGEYRVRAAVEDEIPAVGGLLAGGHLLDLPHEVGGKRAHRSQRFDRERGGESGGNCEDDKTAHRSPAPSPELG